MALERCVLPQMPYHPYNLQSVSVFFDLKMAYGTAWRHGVLLNLQFALGISCLKFI